MFFNAKNRFLETFEPTQGLGKVIWRSKGADPLPQKLLVELLVESRS